MTYSDREVDTAPADELLADMPLPGDPKTIFLGGLFALALLTTAYIASEIVLPLVFDLCHLVCNGLATRARAQADALRR